MRGAFGAALLAVGVALLLARSGDKGSAASEPSPLQGAPAMSAGADGAEDANVGVDTSERGVSPANDPAPVGDVASRTALRISYPSAVFTVDRAGAARPRVVGGSGRRSYTLVEGSLPPTVELDADTGDLTTTGVPYEPTTDGGLEVTVDGTVHTVAVDQLGRILLGGEFSTVGGVPRDALARLDASGRVDELTIIIDGALHAIAIDSKGGLLLGGAFTSVNGSPQPHLARLSPEGSVDPAFAPEVDDTVRAISVGDDGRILLGGSFTEVDGERRIRLARLDADGNLDPSFAPEADGTVRAVQVVPDGGVLVGGSFTTIDGIDRSRFARLSADGSVDATVDVEVDGVVHALAVAARGDVLLGGSFSTVDGEHAPHLALLTADAVIDPAFRPAVDGHVLGLAVQPDGRTILAGTFTRVDGQPRDGVARLGGYTGFPATVTVQVTDRTGSATTEVTLSVAAEAPGGPTAVTATSGETADAVLVSWRPPADPGSGPVTDYVVLYRPIGSEAWTVHPEGVSDLTTVVVGGLEPDTTYEFRVIAVNAAGPGDVGAAPPTPTPPPGPPTAVGPLAARSSDRHVFLRWTAPSSDGGAPILGYLVERRSTPSGGWTRVADGTSTAATTTVAGLDNGTTYELRVAAVNRIGTGPWTTVAGTPRTTPSAPDALTATPGDGQVALAWSAPVSDGGSPLTDYLVQRRLLPAGAWSLVADGPGTATSSTVADTRNGFGYELRVAAVNAAGTGPWSASVTVELPAFADVTGTAGVGGAIRSVGAAWADHDGDGDPDLYVANHAQPNVLYRNNGDGTFTDIAAAAGVAHPGASMGVLWGDYDGDGDPDLYVTNHGPNVLYRNDGDGTFTDVTAVAGVGGNVHSRGGAWVDYDGDADLDLAVNNHWAANVLYRNNGDGTFTDVAAAAGVAHVGPGFSMAWADYDADGDVDAYLAELGGADILYRNNGDGTFTDGSTAAGLGHPGNSRGVAWADADGDGRVDLYVNVFGGPNLLYRNNGNGTFTDITAAAGVGNAGSGVGTAWADHDSDGDLDLYVANSSGQPNALYRNEGDGTFTDVAAAAGVAGARNSEGPAWADSDGDGDLDLYVSNFLQDNDLYRNRMTPPAPDTVHRIRLHRGGVPVPGATIDLLAGSVRIATRVVDAGSGYNSQSPLPASFAGLEPSTAYSIRYRCPGGTTRTAPIGPPTGAVVTVEQSCPPSAPTAPAATPGAGRITLDWSAPHWNGGSPVTDYSVRYRAQSSSTWTTVADGASTATDATVSGLTGGTTYEFQVAARNALGTGAWSATTSGAPPRFVDVAATSGLTDTGSGFAATWADIDRDGDPDVYITNGGQPNVLYRNDGDGTLTDITTTAGVGHPGNSLGAAWGDHDNDGDPDLYVANHGANVLYRNDGDGTFTDITTTAGVGHTANSEGVAWGDGDGDGDLDLYVTNTWGSANNVLYRNNGDGTFTDVTTSAGVGHGGSGRSVTWVDIDQDGDLDLHVANPYADVLYRNNGDLTFTDISTAAGVAHGGWSRGVTWGDYDGDGDLDAYVGNSGANVLYRNNGDLTFTDVTAAAGVGHAGNGNAVTWGDHDADGDLDLFVVNGNEPDVLYRNDGDGTFTDITAAAGTASSAIGNGAGWADADGDGDLDLLVAQFGANLLYRNDGPAPSANTVHRILPVRTSALASGLAVDLMDGATRVATRAVDGGSGYVSQGATPVTFFGLQPATTYAVRFRCPDGTSRTSPIGTPDGVVRTIDATCPPGTPTTLDAVAGDGTVALSWTAPAASGGAPVTDYVVQRRLLPSGSWTGFDDGTSPATTATVTGLANGSGYEFRVAAASAVGVGGWSAVATTALPAFADLTVAAGVGDTGGGAGSAWADHDGDGDLDLYVVNFGQANVLYRNDGDGTFTDGTTTAGVGHGGAGLYAAWGDHDNDGDPDLYVANYAQANVLYRNDGDGTFTDITTTAGVGHPGNSRGVAWGDHDGDGDLDLYVVNNGANVLYRNNGDGTFTDITTTAGVGHGGNGEGAAWGDHDDDGDLDLYVANSAANVLYRNDGDGTFTDITTTAGVGDTRYGVGVTWGDYDDDGDLDLYVANWGQANVLYRNNGDGTFTDVASAAGVASTRNTEGVAWIDHDSDGDLDLSLANWGQANVLYRNNGDGTFTDVAPAAAIANGGNSRSAIWGDVDGDGDPDLYVSNDGANVLYRNRAPAPPSTTVHRVLLRHAGAVAAGVRLDLLDGSTRIASRSLDGSYGAQHAMPVAFAALDPGTAYSIRYRCPDGTDRTEPIGTPDMVLRILDMDCAG